MFPLFHLSITEVLGLFENAMFIAEARDRAERGRQ
jgi:hypothetical protein